MSIKRYYICDGEPVDNEPSDNREDYEKLKAELKAEQEHKLEEARKKEEERFNEKENNRQKQGKLFNELIQKFENIKSENDVTEDDMLKFMEAIIEIPKLVEIAYRLDKFPGLHMVLTKILQYINHDEVNKLNNNDLKQAIYDEIISDKAFNDDNHIFWDIAKSAGYEYIITERDSFGPVAAELLDKHKNRVAYL